MTKRRKIYLAAVLCLTLAAYGTRLWLRPESSLSPDDRDLIAKSCAGESLGTARPLLAGDAVDDRMRERYGSVCRSLELDPHLHFGRGLDAYQCRIWIPRMTATEADQQQAKALEVLFGRRDFDLMTYAQKAGTEATVLLVTDDGEDVAAITDQASLRRGLQQVQDLQGAAELIGFFNETGRLRVAPRLCDVNARADQESWTLSDVRVPENCTPPWWRSYRVDRQGNVQLLSSSKRWWRFDSAICSD